MTRQMLERIALLWCGVAAIAIPVRLRSPAKPAARSVMRTEPMTAAVLPHDSITSRVEAAVSADLFSTPGSHSTATAAQSILPVPGSTPVNPQRRLRLTAIIGPPWRAVIESDGSQLPAVVLEAGDTLQGYRLVRIVSDSIVLTKNRMVSRRQISESWVP
jgi:hypothetical protein